MPDAHPLAAMQPDESRQLLLERFRMLEKMRVVMQQERGAIVAACLDLDTRAAVKRVQQRERQRDRTDSAALRLDEYRPGRIEAAQRAGQQRVEPFLRWLLLTRQRTKQGAAMCRQLFQVQRLRTSFVQCVQQTRLAAAGGAGEHDIPERGRQMIERIERRATIGLMPARQLPLPRAD